MSSSNQRLCLYAEHLAWNLGAYGTGCMNAECMGEGFQTKVQGHPHSPSISEAVYFDMEDLRDKVFYLFGFGF